ncbi:MAG: hypothetical protein LAT77_02290 [Aliidiomarina sp.]|uniref:ATP-binding protein n=1 Tax=Aliidiomarina sp. TaxID=1872439 RepID=UPI0025C30682|nr:ATP-binding protein [Aliidiomarina sp.]MCH8500722.1 hypothetical protein [Aliidiomarina sp.]
MRRLAFHFYGFLLLAVVGLGWTIEQLWSSQQNDMPAWVEPLAESFVNLSQYIERPEQLEQALDLPVQVVGSGQVRWPAAQQSKFAAGEPVILFGDSTQLYVYIQHRDDIWRVGPVIDETPSPTYAYHLLFFLLLAVVTTIWLWPLSRDLKRLEEHLRYVSQPDQKPLNLSKRSLVYPLALSFNTMRERIWYLLGIQRDLTHAVSHDLRTPLARMKFALALPDSPTKTEALQEDVQEMEAIVDTLLDYARMEAQEELMEREDVDVSELCSHVVEKYQRDGARSIHLTAPEHLHFCCDGHYLERALNNLLQNASRHANNKVHVEVIQRQGELVIHVDDDGAGIPASERQKILKPFVRLEESRSRDSGGAGLGLTIVSRIMEWHGGRIDISDSPLGGARFSLILPEPPKI